MQFRKLHLWIRRLLSSSGDMSNRIGFVAAGDFIGPLLTTVVAGAAGAGVVIVAVVAAGNETVVAFDEKEMNRGRLLPARAVTRTMAPPRPFSAAWQVVAVGPVTRSRPEVDIDSGEEGGVNVWTD